VCVCVCVCVCVFVFVTVDPLLLLLRAEQVSITAPQLSQVESAAQSRRVSELSQMSFSMVSMRVLCVRVCVCVCVCV
jgi:hypothetical protein